jgi:Na+(H+)/acetate symporter ActP
MSRNNFYNFFRVFGACLAIIASLAWMLERISGESNFVSAFIQSETDRAMWLVPLLAVLALCSYVAKIRVFTKKQNSI